MKKYISPIEKMLLLPISFTMLLLVVRICYTKELTYGFYIWNTFLAVMPLLFSRKLASLEKCRFRAILLIAGWLVFFPNAPYMITDLFHYSIRPPVPQWFDLLLVTSAAWNGLFLGILSLMQVEHFLSIHFKKSVVTICIFTSTILCGYGVYIGRFLRYNSWDVATNPREILFTIAHHLLQPQEHIRTWSFTLLFAAMFAIIYCQVRHLRSGYEIY
jgi:uncharacterized membrane protein